MAVDYAGLAQTAKDLITEFGQDVTLVTDNDGTYDPSTNTFTGASETNTTAKGAKLNYSNRDIDGEVIKRGDAKLYLDAVNITTDPTTADQVIINSEEWSVVDVMPLQPAATVVVYILQIRK